MIRTITEISQREHNELRMRRTCSWLERSEKAGAIEEKFIFLWVAFNAAYGSAPSCTDDNQPTENLKIKNFLGEIIKRDEEGKIESILWEKYPAKVRILLENPFVFRPFWRWVRRPSNANDWRERFESNREKTRIALAEKNVHCVFSEVFRRLYELRNQVFHGNVTFAQRWGRKQLRDCTHIMSDVVPVILDIMKAEIDANPESIVWGRLAYPGICEDELEEPQGP